MNSILLTFVAAVISHIYGEPWAGGIFWHLIYVHDRPAGWILVLLLLLLLVIGGRLQSRTFVSTATVGLWVYRYRFRIALVLWAALCIGTVTVYRNHPLSMDEYAAFFQARIFSAGHLSAHFPPDLLDSLIPKPFQGMFLVTNSATGEVASAYWPGFALLLTPFVLADIPWACNPTLTALSLLLIGRLARDVFISEVAQGWAILFALASAEFTLNGITYYSMPAHLLMNLLFAWLLCKPTPKRLISAGIVGSLALSLHNPFPHILFAAPWLVWLTLRSKFKLRNALLLGVGYIPLSLLLVAGWSIFLMQLMQGGQVTHLVSSGAGIPPMASPLDYFPGPFRFPDGDILEARVGGLVKLWLWSTPMLMVFAWIGATQRLNTATRLLTASIFLTFFGYLVVGFDQGHGWGYRYFHSAWSILPILAAAISLRTSSEHVAPVSTLIGSVVIGLVVMTPLRAWQMSDFMSSHLAQLPPIAGGQGELVIHSGYGYYSRDLIQNDPWLQSSPIIFITRGKEADEAMLAKRFPTAIHTGNNRYGSTYRVLSGPVPSAP